ncbi:retrovirus-related Pol polyprotein from transposon opus [Trichonephila clavipes]|nr:retrovirus-related Pol polyprotein from transposon opus [Trichonephila clavipes]
MSTLDLREQDTIKLKCKLKIKTRQHLYVLLALTVSYECHMRKCHFASSRVKYLGFWITQKGIEVDPEKVASILDIPPSKNVKELQSFLQTCSWFRRYIQDFAKISRPLSYLTKKKVKWQWGFDQQNAFQTLKNSLTTPPVLKQADGTKPYIIRTDAGNYALGAVLLQGEGSDEYPIEYASRLLQQQFPTEPSISQQELLLQQLIMSPRRDAVGSIGGDCNPPVV